MRKLKNQKGMVLVTGLIFLLIAMLACVTTLENVGILAYEQGNNIQKYRLFYQLEAQLNALEKPFIEGTFNQKDLENLLKKQNIKNISEQTEEDFLDDIWEQQSYNLRNEKGFVSLIEYIGAKPISFPENVSSEITINSWIFRISLASLYEQDYWLQSIIEVYPIEAVELNRTSSKQESNLKEGHAKFITQRIAWYERFANE